MTAKFFFRFVAAAAAAAIVVTSSPALRAAETPLHALFVGGGPDADGNGAEIESHLRFTAQLLPRDANCFVHFTDGKPRTKTVAFTDSSKLSLGRRALQVLLPDGEFGPATETRAPKLGIKVDGAALQDAIRRSFGKLAMDAAKRPAPLLVYFAGHGSNNSGDEDNNSFNLWNHQSLSVSNLASELARLPPGAPIVLVMVQCYSGAFANVIFRHGEPGNELIDHDIVGFFAAAKDRMSAGCGWEIHEPEYQDFSSYFFGAISGRNRLGQPVTGADADGDGTVSLHEAYCFALIHDESGDTPNCTSDAFLRRFASLPEAELCATAFTEIHAAATPAQRAALDALSDRLALGGEDRFRAAHDRLTFRDPIARSSVQDRAHETGKALNDLRQTTLASLFTRWPALRWSDSDGYDDAAEKAESELSGKAALCREILAASDAWYRANSMMESEEAFLLRFTGLCASVARAEHLRTHGQAPIKARLKKLCTAEQRTLPLRAP